MILIVESVVVNADRKLIKVALKKTNGHVYNGVVHIVETRGIVGLQGLEKILEEMDEEVFGVLLPKFLFRVLRGEGVELPYEMKL